MRELYEELTTLGYEILAIERFGLQAFEIDSVSHMHNWLAVPASQRSIRKRIDAHLRRCALLPCVPGLNPLSRR